MNGFTFDTGPTFLLMRFVLEDIFGLCGRRAEDYMAFMPLDPMYQLRFDDRNVYVSSDHQKMRDELRRAFPDDADGFDRFLAVEEERFRHLYPCIQRDYSSPTRFLSWHLLRALPKLAITESVFSNLGQYFKQDKARLTFSFQSKYLGMSPWECPAFFTMLPFIEHKYGIFHVKGGLNRISAGMADVIRELGGTIHTSTPVESLLVEGRAARGVHLTDGSEVRADEVIVNADFAHAMSKLVPGGVLRKHRPESLKQREFSCSTFMLYLGLKTRYDLPHHTIVFAKDYRSNVENTFKRKSLSEEFSFYVQNACATDPSLAPEGKSALYVLVPVPNNQSGLPWPELRAQFRERTLDALSERMGLADIREQIECEKIIDPATWESDEHVYLGATFSLSHKLSQLLYWRPRNRFEDLDNCYLVGGGTHPGSGLPTIYISARLSSDLICRKYGMALPAFAPLP
jgi:phytoene desaturase